MFEGLMGILRLGFISAIILGVVYLIWTILENL